MKSIRKMFAAILALTMVVSVMAQPVYAAEVSGTHLYYFGQFNKVPPSNNYQVAAVAVQKFLMLYGNSYAQALMPYGADGYYGSATETQVKRFQCQERPHGGTEAQEKSNSNYGSVDTPTWKAIAANLEVEELIDTAGARFYRFNRSYYDLTENVIAWNGSGYYAYNDNDAAPVSTPFYSIVQ